MKSMRASVFLMAMCLAPCWAETNVVVVAAASPEALDSRMFELTYANAAEVAENFNRTWRGWRGPGWEVSDVAVPFVDANAVMVTATPAILASCEKMIAQADRPPKQVYIEARFVTLKNSARYNLGIDWRLLEDLTLSGNLSASFTQQKIPDNITSYTEDINGKTVQKYSFNGGGRADNGYFQGTISTSTMNLILSALQKSEDAKTFSNPKVIVGSGRKATVDMTTKRPNVVLSTKRVVNGGSSTVDVDMKVAEIPGNDMLMFAKEAFYSWGISLEVTPRVMRDGIINVKIVPTLSEEGDAVTPEVDDDNVAKVSYPSINVQRIVTEFSLKSGMTAVIGGLSKTEEVDYDSGIPWLCDIPWIGNKLFGGIDRVKVQNEVLVFVTVGECDAADLKVDAGLPKNAVLGRGYTNGTRQEPGDRTNAVEGVMSLDLRPLEDRAAEKAVQP